MSQELNYDQIRALPKVVLHDHLDGGLRPQTVLELAAHIGHELPARDPQALGEWFVTAADSGSLELYLKTFEHTVAVMQTKAALDRVAYEMVWDMANDGVIYVESRWAPEQHLEQGLTLQEAVDAVQTGIDRAVNEVIDSGRWIQVNQILSAMRHLDRWEEIADLALANRTAGVCGFDIAGPEAGFGPDRFSQVWTKLATANFPVTVHAGEADGLESINQALHIARARRLGHGARIVDDITSLGTSEASLGYVADWILDNQVPLEMCPCSNLQTGIAASVAQHPITALKELDFAVTINTDNRLMSGTSMTHEMHQLVIQANWNLEDLLSATLTAAGATFLRHHEREVLGYKIISEYQAILN